MIYVGAEYLIGNMLLFKVKNNEFPYVSLKELNYYGTQIRHLKKIADIKTRFFTSLPENISRIFCESIKDNINIEF